MTLAQVSQLVVFEVKSCEKIQNVTGPGRDDVLAGFRHPAECKVENGQLIQVLGRVSLRIVNSQRSVDKADVFISCIALRSAVLPNTLKQLEPSGTGRLR
jgi:hypothetical protein